jgi:transcriptional regulator with XRE-family HTH domain
MLAPELIDKIRRFKEDHGYTLHDLSRLTDISVSTWERWLKTSRINRMYAQIVKEKLSL